MNNKYLPFFLTYFKSFENKADKKGINLKMYSFLRLQYQPGCHMIILTQLMAGNLRAILMN